jgi:hypothetical protein
MIWLTVTPTGVSQQVKIMFELPDGCAARLYWVEDLPAQPVAWNLGADTYTQSGEALVNGLPNQQCLFMLVADCGAGAALSGMVRATPYSAEPVCSIDLSRDVINVYPTAQIPNLAYRLRIQTRDAVNMPSEIFLYQQERDPITGAAVDGFKTVCSPADLDQFPVGTTTLGEPPFYRLADIDVVLPSLEQVDYFWQSVRNAVTDLQAGIDIARRLEVNNLLSFESGVAPVSSSSSSM